MAQKKPDAEEILRKSAEEMSDIERMMADILQEYGDEAAAAPKKDDRKAEKGGSGQGYASPAPPSRQRARRTAPAEDVHAAAAREEADALEKRERDKERERAIRDASRRRSGTIAIVVLVLIILLVLGSIVYTKVFEDIRERGILPRETPAQTEEPQEAEPEVTFPPDMVFPTPEQEEAVNAGSILVQPPAGSIVIISDTTPTPEQQDMPHEHGYQFFTEDVSWTEAQQKCISLGGHLAVVSSAEELNEITALAAANNIQKVWLGCHRENGALVWENGETVDFYAWGRGEPSLYDSGDKVAEDYLLLWYFNGAWVYNDSRNDPVHDYPQMYSGQIGYVCEFE